MLSEYKCCMFFKHFFIQHSALKLETAVLCQCCISAPFWLLSAEFFLWNSKVFLAISKTPSLVSLPPINPPAWTKIQPGIPLSWLKDSSRIPRHSSNKLSLMKKNGDYKVLYHKIQNISPIPPIKAPLILWKDNAWNIRYNSLFTMFTTHCLVNYFSWYTRVLKRYLKASNSILLARMFQILGCHYNL